MKTILIYMKILEKAVLKRFSFFIVAYYSPWRLYESFRKYFLITFMAKLTARTKHESLCNTAFYGGFYEGFHIKTFILRCGVILTTVSSLTLLTSVLVLFLFITPSESAQNPFLSKNKNHKALEAVAIASPPNPFIFKISLWQKKLNHKMSSMLKKVHKEREILPFLILLSISFIYGVIHAAGPGHGKTVAASYLAAQGKKIKDGIIIGNIIAMVHGLSGVILIMILNALLTKGISGKVENLTHTIQLVSYCLITLIGVFLFIKSLIAWWKKETVNRKESAEKQEKSSLLMAVTIGCIPCPGIILIMLFSISLNATSLGIILALSMSMGMAFTISIVGIGVIAGKKALLGSLNRHQIIIVEHTIASVSAFLIMIIGMLLFLSSL